MDDVFWLLWLATVSVCGWNLLEGWRNPARMLGFPFLSSLMCLYFYGYMAMCAFSELRFAFRTEDAVIGQFLVLLCLLAIHFGWKAGLIKPKTPAKAKQYSYGWIWLIGLLLMLTATAVHFSFHGTSLQARSGQNFRGSTAYWYMFFWVGYPGLSVSIWALCNMKKSERKPLMTVSLIVFAIFIFPHIYTARRGPLLPAVIILLFMPAFALKKKPSRVMVTGGLVLAGLAMLTFVQARRFLNNDKTWTEAFNTINAEEIIRTKVSQVGDNEYVNHIYFVGTLNKTGKWQYGTGHFSLLLHWIPRKVWQDKPHLGEGFFWRGQLFDDLNAHAGSRSFGGGAAAGGFADTFLQYGYATPIFWYILVFYFARLYSAAIYGSHPTHIFSYIAVLSSTHWLISQGIAASFVPCLIFIFVPKAILFYTRKSPRKKIPSKKTIVQHRQNHRQTSIVSNN